MMNRKTAALVSSAIFSLLWLPCTGLAEVDTRAIDAVRSKTVLDAGDLQVIDEFVASAVKDIMRTRDFSQVSKARAVLIGKKGPQPQYAQQFSDSCKKQIAAGLEQAAANLPNDRRFKVMVNLLILADGLQDPALVDLGLGYLGHPDAALRYWAVRLVTNGAAVDKMKQGNWPVGGQIMSGLAQCVRSSAKQGATSEAILGPIAEFAAKVGTAEGQALLAEIADLRIAQQSQGQVQDGQVDTTILKLLCAQVNTGTDAAKKSSAASRFAQLYSYVIQRLAKSGSRLTEAQRELWASVVVEVEDKCVGPALEGYQMPLRKAIEKGDMSALQAEHDRLLGSSTQQGQLVAKWQFDYGRGADGKPQTWPQELALQTAASK
jgi:hypothetical protein